MDQFPQIAREVQRSCTGVGEDIPGIFIRYTVLLVRTICPLDNFQVIRKFILIDAHGCYEIKSVLGAVPLTTLSKTAMPVSYKLMGTGSGDTFNLEGKINMLKY
jgi:hypothetical protein